MDAIMAIFLILFGLVAGIVGGFLGIGGCVIMLPALYFLFGYPLPLAIGTTITAVMITAASGSIAHIRIRNVDYRTMSVIAVSGGIGAVVGSLIFAYLVNEITLLNLILGLAFLYVSIRMIYEGFLKRKTPEKTGKSIPGGVLPKSLIGLSIGILTGIVGLGGGYALVPSFIYLLGAPVRIAVGTSLPSFISMAVISGSFKLYQGYVDILAAIALGSGTAIGAQVGARLVPRAPTWVIKAIFGLVFLYVSLKFILIAFGIRI
ncbi:MAG: sulfite exporter TauE/SafE family protein, partial [Thaumarchaeota archaeon]